MAAARGKDVREQGDTTREHGEQEESVLIERGLPHKPWLWRTAALRKGNEQSSMRKFSTSVEGPRVFSRFPGLFFG